MDLETVFSTDNKKFNRAIVYHQFIENQRSDNTKLSYKHDLIDFFIYASKVKLVKSELRVCKDDIEAYLANLKRRKYSHNTINRRLSSISAFYTFLLDENFVKSNPCKAIKRISTIRNVSTKALDNKDVIRILNVIDTSTFMGIFHRAVLEILFTTGIRVGELTSLQFKHIKLVENKYSFNIMPKGKRFPRVLLNDQCTDLLSKYLEECKKHKFKTRKSDFVFRSSQIKNDGSYFNNKLHTSSINYFFQKYLRLAKIEGHYTIHSTRATLIGHLYEKGHDMYTIAEYVGHSDPRLTNEYFKNSKLRHKRVFEDSNYN